VNYGEVLGDKCHVHLGEIRLSVPDYIVTISFGCISHCGSFSLSCNVCVCVCVCVCACVLVICVFSFTVFLYCFV
jgi:hypothetical protein